MPARQPTPEDIDTFARTLWGEARGEGEAGIRAVAAVIVNRRNAAVSFIQRHPEKGRHPLFGDGSFASTCTANPNARYRQFSCWNQDDPNLAKMLKVTAADKDFVLCTRIATEAVAGDLSDPTDGATHYYDPRVCSPVWIDGATLALIEGHHRFYKNVR